MITWHVCRPCHEECEPFFPYCMFAMQAQMEREEAEWNLESDLAHEDDLAWAYVHGESDCPWPWYADNPSIRYRPQVFGP